MEQIDYTRHYQNWHSDTPEHIATMVSFYKSNVLQYFTGNKDALILDIGCGMGFLLLALKSVGYKNAMGIDTDEGQVNSCIAKGLSVEMVADSIAYLNQNKQKFDVITAFDVIEHIPPDIQISFCKAIREALKPQGFFVATVPNANSFLASRNRYIDFTHHVTFTEISLDFILYNAGFKKIEIQPMDFVKFSANPLKFLHWILFKTFRMFRRLNFIAELGLKQGKRVPLSFNLLVKASID
jgi:SAM-dependent methyltransferase